MEIIPSYWQSITLNDLNNKAAMQTRMDRKYIVDADYAASVLAELPAEASVLEIEGQREFAYDSVYFDTPQPGQLLRSCHRTPRPVQGAHPQLS